MRARVVAQLFYTKDNLLCMLTELFRKQISFSLQIYIFANKNVRKNLFENFLQVKKKWS